MYCIAVLIDKGQKGQDYAEYILNYCADRKIFPLVQNYQDQEKFFREIQKTIPSIVLLALQGVAGLNAAEHLRSLHPKCKMIWCSDLDFSLHAFKLRVEYFFYGTRGGTEALGRAYGMFRTQVIIFILIQEEDDNEKKSYDYCNDGSHAYGYL